jgi:rubrerythrin
MGLIDEIPKEEDAKWMALADKYADDAEAEISQKPTIQEEIKKTWDMIEARSMPPEMFDKHEEAMIKELKRRHQEHVETWRCQFCGNQSSVCTCKI